MPGDLHDATMEARAFAKELEAVRRAALMWEVPASRLAHVDAAIRSHQETLRSLEAARNFGHQPEPEEVPIELPPISSSMADVDRSLTNCLALHARDWAQNSQDAWLWGIICGWDGPAMRDVANKHRWSKEDVARLRGLRAAYVAAVRRSRPRVKKEGT